MNNDTLVKLMTELLLKGESDIYGFYTNAIYLHCSAYWDSTGISGITLTVKLENYDYGQLFFSYNRLNGETLRTIKQAFDVPSDEKVVNQILDSIIVTLTMTQEYK